MTHIPASVPLIVDLDGTLLATDMFWEGVVASLRSNPFGLIGAAATLGGGPAAIKSAVARLWTVDPARLPYRREVLELVASSRASGQSIVLASGAAQAQVALIARHIGADEFFGTTATYNMTGNRKLAAIRERYPTFDYVGDSRADIPLWRAARNAFAPAGQSAARALAVRPDATALPGRAATSGWRAWRKQLRVHQWAKNLLLFLPALAAHLEVIGPIGIDLLLGFMAFSLLASAVYIVNDLWDLPSDRLHSSKRNRPLAAGAIQIPAALAGAVACLICSALLALRLPIAFQWTLLGYAAMTCAYSFSLKRRLLVDVITLSMLYTVRVTAGAALVAVPLSRWFLAFSVFLFFSLALVKRVVELRALPTEGDAERTGRRYRSADIPVLVGLGCSATCATALVYCLYITSRDVPALYHRPDLLWAGLPLILYWQARIWIFTLRDAMREDPVLFAIKDRLSYVVAAAFLLVVWAAK